MRRRVGLLAVIGVLFSACVHKVERELADPSRSTALDTDSEFLKAHMRDGGLYVLTAWDVNEADERVSGHGTLFDYNRRVLDTGLFEVALDSVALFETNAVRVSSSIVPLTVMTVGTVAAGVYCAVNPKACFGSCPTFYLPGEEGRILAEGFSASVAPSLEDSDLVLICIVVRLAISPWSNNACDRIYSYNINSQVITVTKAYISTI